MKIREPGVDPEPYTPNPEPPLKREGPARFARPRHRCGAVEAAQATSSRRESGNKAGPESNLETGLNLESANRCDPVHHIFLAALRRAFFLEPFFFVARFFDFLAM